ncbi:MAG TPA: DUF5131 family protein, partial [Pirellulales bacterium]|nr:DUF5131 family protein [Pirellulales bacterium]
MGVTSIQWTDHSWNPIRANDSRNGATGHYCEKVSPGCTNCYASAMQRRFRMPEFDGRQLNVDSPIVPYLDEKTLMGPLKRKKPTKYFVCDMTDLFGRWVPDVWIDSVFAVAAMCPQHTFQVLTKRHERMFLYMRDAGLRQHEWTRRAMKLGSPTW